MKYRDRLRKLMNSISMDVEELPGVRFLEKGDPVIAQNEDMFWYRGRVLSTSESTARVEFVDFGNTDEIITEDMRIMNREMLSDHVFCIKCVLNKVVVAEESQTEAIGFLNKTLVDVEAIVTITVDDIDYDKEVAIVTLTQNGENVNEFVNKTYGPLLENSFRTRKIVLGEEIGLTPLPATSISEFPCLFSDSSNELKLLMQNLSDHYKDESKREILTSLDVESLCCVLRESDDQWYRGSIKSVDENISVRFVDYGFTEDVIASNIFKLESVFLHLEVQSITCKLFDLLRSQDNDDAWSIDSVEHFNKICANKTLYGTMLNQTKHLYSVALTFENGETVYEMLTEQNNPRPN